MEERRASAGGRHPSGFLLLSGPQAAYSSRLALVDAAQKTLDLQYYAIHADASTERLLLSVVAAARRGVRVRVLLDDFHSVGRDAQVMRLAFVPNIEMRMFNPLTGARGSPLGRMFSALSDFSRVQQRMHNKLFIADNAMGVTGGRNLGDAYFGNADSGNFVDLDVLAAGPVVQDLSRSFRQLLEQRARLPRAIAGHAGGTGHSARAHAQLGCRAARAYRRPGWRPGTGQPARARRPANHRRPACAHLGLPAHGPGASRSSPGPLRRCWWTSLPRFRPMAPPWPRCLKSPRPGPPPSPSCPRGAARAPAKAPTEALTVAAGAAATPRIVSIQSRQRHPHRPLQQCLPPDPATLDAQTDTVVDGLLHLMGQARRDLLIISPYFVPGPDMKQAFAAARARGVRVRVLTNSLASNDAPIAHAGYARHRPDLLAMGVELYEMRSELTGVLRGALGSTGSTGGRDGISGAASSVGSSRAMLHSKILIMDGRLLVVGSMNLDIRSQRQNTEIALLIRSSDLSRRATTQIETALREAAWHVQVRDGGQLVWHAPEGSGMPDATTEPDASAPLRLMLQLLGPLAPDHLL